MLAAGAAGTEHLHLDFLGTDLNFAVVLDFRHDLQGGKAGLPPGIGIEGAHPHQAVYAVFALEIAVGVVPLDEDGGGFDAGLVTVLIVQQLVGEPVALGPAGVHTVEHLCPVLGLGAAGPGVEGEDGVVGVVLPGEQGRQTALAYLLFQSLTALGHLVQLAGVVLLLGHLAQGQGVFPVGDQVVVLLDFIFQALDLLSDALAALHIVPKALLLRFNLQLGELFSGGLNIQRLLQLLQRRLQGQKLLLISIIFNDCHGRCLLLNNSLAFLL